jgi:Flp pilus assembly protein TadB
VKQRSSSGWAPEAEDHPGEDGADTMSAPEGSPGILGLVGHALLEGRLYAETEIERQKLRARVLGAAGRDTLLLAVSALFLLFGALTTLLIGCVWILAPLIGVAFALVATLLVTFIVVVLLLVAARARMRKAMRLAFPAEDRA